ncbi:hypothetical protein ONZ45_g1861 [Pleurotus djamor]|nr:hypothetical protein ONZ45_g1861 [Pleurotus djamor]
MHSFSKKQLRQGCRLYGMDGRATASSRSKVELARSIIEKQWGWPSLFEVRQKQQAWVQEVRSYPLDPRQSFVILGKDGSDLLALSAKYDVHVTLSSNPLALHATGRRGSLQKLAARIETITSNIQETIFELPSRVSLSSDILQSISRLTGAFVENFGKAGQLRISAVDEHSMSIARRLALRASYEVNAPNLPILACLSVGSPREQLIRTALLPSSYSVYPFLASRPLPLTIVSNGTFRVRKVTEWLNTDRDVPVDSASFLSPNSLQDQEGQPIDLKTFLLSKFPTPSPIDSPPFLFTASLGHVLIPSLTDGRATISPPLKGSWPFPKVMDWWKSHKIQPVFIPSRPDSFVHNEPKEQVLHSLVYISQTKGSGIQRLLKFHVVLQSPDAMNADHSSPSQDLSPDAQTRLALSPKCEIVEETSVDILSPDRPMDIRLTACRPRSLTKDSWPASIVQYFSSLQDFLTKGDAEAIQPESPFILHHEEDTFVLQSNLSVRRALVSQTADGIQVETENILDLESNQSSTICQVINPASVSESAWSTFVNECDRLTANAEEPEVDAGQELII